MVDFFVIIMCKQINLLWQNYNA